MQRWNCQILVVEEPNTSIQDLLTDLKACSKTRNLERGKQVHAQAVKCGHFSNVYVASALINMYGRCSSMVDAHQVFDSLSHPDVVSWTALILGYAENGQGLTALNLFTKLRSEGPAPNSVTFVAALKACTSLMVKTGINDYRECMQRGKEIHDLAVEYGCKSNIYVQSTLIDMYSKFGSIAAAHEVFDSIKYPNAVSWNALILGYADNGQGLAALKLFARMKCGGPAPNSLTLVAALKACTSLAMKGGASDFAECSHWGEEIHKYAVNNCLKGSYILSALISMYARCGRMVEAHEVFDSVKNPDVVSWNALILGYAENGQGVTALGLVTRMVSTGPALNSVTIMAALKACICLKEDDWEQCSRQGRKIHEIALENGLDSDVHVQNALIDMYSKCGDMFSASQVFNNTKRPDVVSWTTLILGYAENGQGFTALNLFSKMKYGPEPDHITFVACLKACILQVDEESEWQECRNRGKLIQNLVVERECDTTIYVQNTLIELYSRCGAMVDAQQVFDSTQNKNVVVWNTLIMGYADNGQGASSLDMFMSMKSEGFAPNSVTFVAVLKACKMLGALEFGRAIHAEITHLDVVLVSCLVNFYAKCGSMMEAQSVFYVNFETRNIVTWNAFLAGFSSFGDKEAVFGIFQEMQEAGFEPDSVTFISILTFCSHAGLVEKGKACFDSMSTRYGIVPTVEHYTCMIDIFGRANKLDDAMDLLKWMPCIPDYVTWTTILNVCCMWKHVEVGRLAFQSLLNFHNRDGACYVVMGLIYASRGMFQEQEMIMEMSISKLGLKQT